MPFYEVIHHIALTTPQREKLASGITDLHCQTFNAPSHFVNIRFSHTQTGSMLAQQAPAFPDYFVAGKARPQPNLIFGHVRSGSSRSNEAFAILAEGIEKVWDNVVGLPAFKYLEKKKDGEMKEVKDGAEASGENLKKVRNWNDERRLQAVFIVPGLVARESALAIPEAGGESDWIKSNWSKFQSRADEGDADMKNLIDEIEGRGKDTKREGIERGENGERSSDRQKITDRTKEQ